MNNTIKYVKIGFLAAAITSISFMSKAQVLPLNAQYFQNKYLGNAAMAGLDDALLINGSLRKQWSNLPGSPITQGITLDQKFGKVGLGMNVYGEKTGALQYTKAMATFAYHVPLKEGETLNFGISFGASKDRFDLNSLRNANPNDPSLIRFNERGYYMDGDFGAAYISNQLSVEFALPNIRAMINSDSRSFTDKPTFYSSASYKFNFGSELDAVSLEPKAVYRGIRNYDNLWDAGFNMSFANEKLYLTSLYHSAKNATFGFGMNFKSSIYFMAYYNTPNAALKGLTSGDFEVNVKLRIGK